MKGLVLLGIAWPSSVTPTLFGTVANCTVPGSGRPKINKATTMLATIPTTTNTATKAGLDLLLRSHGDGSTGRTGSGAGVVRSGSGSCCVNACMAGANVPGGGAGAGASNAAGGADGMDSGEVTREPNMNASDASSGLS